MQKREVSAMEGSGLASSTGVSDNVSSKSQTGSVKCESSVSTSGADIMQESFPEFSSSLFSDLTPEEDCLQSGPSTEANNTVIYRGSILADGQDDSILGSERATGNDSTLGCVASKLFYRTSRNGTNESLHLVSYGNKRIVPSCFICEQTNRSIWFHVRTNESFHLVSYANKRIVPSCFIGEQTNRSIWFHMLQNNSLPM